TSFDITRLDLYYNTLPPTHTYTLSLHDALPISAWACAASPTCCTPTGWKGSPPGPAWCCAVVASDASCAGSRATDSGTREPRARSEEHTSELQSRFDLVCRLLLEKQKNYTKMQK